MQIKSVSERQMYVFFDIHILSVYRDINLRTYNDAEDKVKLSRETMRTSGRRRMRKREVGYWGMLNKI